MHLRGARSIKVSIRGFIFMVRAVEKSANEKYGYKQGYHQQID